VTAANYWATLRLIGRDARLLIATQALMGFGYVGAYAVLFNLYLLRLGYDAAYIGQVNGIGRLGFALVGVPAGLLGVRYGPRPLLIAGELVIVVGLVGAPLCEFVPAAWQGAWVTLGCFLGFAGASLFFVNALPYLMSVSGERERSHVFSMMGMMMPLASFAGSLVGGFLPGLTCRLLDVTDADPAAYRWPLMAAGTLFLLTLPLVMATRPAADADDRADHPLRGLPQAPVRTIAGMALVMLLVSVGFGIPVSFFNLYLDDGLGAATEVIGTITAATQIVAAPAMLLLPLVVARFGYRGGFAVSRAIMALAYLPVALIPTLRAATGWMLAVMSTSAISQQIFNIHSQSSVAPRWRTLMSGIVNTTMGVGWGATAFAGGLVIERWGYETLFLGGSAASALTVVLYLVVAPRIGVEDARRKSPEEAPPPSREETP
jgi:MFS family permease